MLLRSETGLGAVLLLLAIGSAVACVHATHESRKQFVELQGLMVERDELEVEWGQLRIEQSTWSRHSRVERMAVEEMRMRTPDTSEILLVRP